MKQGHSHVVEIEDLDFKPALTTLITGVEMCTSRMGSISSRPFSPGSSATLSNRLTV